MTDDSQSGAMAPQLLIVLFLISALALGAALMISGLYTLEKKENTDTLLREAAQQIAESVITDLKKDPSPEINGPDDPVWQWNDRNENGYLVRIRPLSDAINPNFVRKNMLEKTSLGNLLINGKSADELQQFREDSGLAARITAYKDFFDVETSSKYLSVNGWANVNVMDEFSARKLAFAATGSKSDAESVYASIRDALAAKDVITQDRLKTFLGLRYSSLFPFINAEPLMNINYVDQFVLKSVLEYPDFKTEDTERKYNEILLRREKAELSQNELYSILGIDKSSRLYYYFGSVTWFWEITITGVNQMGRVVICRVPQDSNSGIKEQQYKIVEMSID